MERHTTTLEYEFDGWLYRAEVPTEAPKREGANRVVKSHVWEDFERRVTRQIVRSGARGPKTFRFLRGFCGHSIVRLAELLDVDRTTVHRWEAGDVPVPRVALAMLMAMAARKARTTVEPTALLSRLARPEADEPRVVDLDAA